MTPHELNERLLTERVVAIAEAEWRDSAASFPEVERHDTMVAGHLLIVRTPSGLAAVEQPKPDERVIRHLGDHDAVRQFVSERLSLYERMWDGCGCKVDYYA